MKPATDVNPPLACPAIRSSGDSSSDLGPFAEWRRAGDSELVHRLAEHRPEHRTVFDPAMRITAGDIARRSVNGEEVAAACDELGLGRMTRARLSRTVLT